MSERKRLMSLKQTFVKLERLSACWFPHCSEYTEELLISATKGTWSSLC